MRDQSRNQNSTSEGAEHSRQADQTGKTPTSSCIPGREIEIVTYAHAADNEPTHLALTEEDFVTLLTEHDDTDCTYPCAKCEFKNGLAWSPGVIQPGRRRGGANVAYLDVLAYDFDHLMPSTLQSLLERLDDERVLVYSTHRHTPEAPKVRVVFFLSRRITPQEFRTLHASVAAHFGLTELMDKKCKDASHLYFFPTSPRGAPRIGVYNDEGRYLDVDKHIVAQQLRTMERQRAPDVGQQEEPEAVDLGSLRARLARYNPQDDFDGQKREFVRRMRAGEALADKGGRDDAIHRSASILAWNLPLNTPVEAAMELIRPSIMAIPQYDDDGPDENPDGWMRKAEYSFTKTAEKKLAEAEERNLFLAALKKKTVKDNSNSVRAVASHASSVDATSVIPSVQLDGDGEAWRLRLQTTMKAGGRSAIKKISSNVAAVLEHHPLWKQCLRFNAVTKSIDLLRSPLPFDESRPEQVLSAIECWLQREIGLDVHSSIVRAMVLFVAQKNGYDPLRDWLLNLRWDGLPRLDTWLQNYCGVVTTDEDGEDISDHIAKIGRRWLVGGAARALEPGCKMDNALVLEGPQGGKKSGVFDVLGGEYFAEAHHTIWDKDSKMLAACTWIIEMPELAAMRRPDIEAMKAFFSARVDRFRPPYGRRVEVYPRRCLFGGSTNETTYLRDDTGNRRFWPVRCGRIDLAALRRDRNQLWAEAVAIYRSGETCEECALSPDKRCKEHRWWLDEAEAIIAERVASQRLQGGAYADAILSWLLKKEPAGRPRYLTMPEIAAALGIQPDRLEGQSPAIGRALKVLNCRKDRPRVAGVPTYRYSVPERLLTEPKLPESPRSLTPVSANAAGTPRSTHAVDGDSRGEPPARPDGGRSP